MIAVQQNYHFEPKVDRDVYVDIDKLTQDGLTDTEESAHSYERESRWKPHLSWSFLSWSLQQRMEEQAAQRELVWQKIADKLGPMLVADGGLTFGQNDFSTNLTDDRPNERLPIVSHNQSTYQSNQKDISSRRSSLKLQKDNTLSSHLSQPKLTTKERNVDKFGNYRFITVSSILILLIILLFTIIILMALGVLPYSMHKLQYPN